ncbi:DUF1889 family protein [Nannocystaceae bacterium ST9]
MLILVAYDIHSPPEPKDGRSDPHADLRRDQDANREALREWCTHASFCRYSESAYAVQLPTAPNQVSDPVVERALASLTNRVNLSTGISRSGDKAAAVGMFRILKQAGHRWTGDEVAGRALEMGWQATDARELGNMADGVMAGRTFRAPGASEAWAKDILQTWQKAATSR